MSQHKEELLRQQRLLSQDIITLSEDIHELLDPLEQEFEKNPNEAARDKLMFVRGDLVKVVAELMGTDFLHVEWLLLVRRRDETENLTLPVEYVFPYSDLCGFVAEADKRFRLRRCDLQVAWLHACYSAEKGFGTENRSAVRAFLISRNGRVVVERLAQDFLGGERWKLYEALLALNWQPYRPQFRDIEAHLREN